MSRNFNGSSDHITSASTPITSGPLTVAAWIRHEATGNDGIVNINNNGSTNTYFSLLITSSIRPSWRVRSGGVTTALGPSDISLNTWYHVAGVEVASNSRFCYIDGVAGTEDTGNKNPGGLNDISIGRFGDSSPSNYFDGDIAEVGIWNVALTTAELASLADGATPPMIRPDALVYYMPLTRQTYELIGNISQTVSGTTVNVGPPKMLRRAGQLVQFPPTASGTTFFQTNTGLLVPTGAILRTTQKAVIGAVTPTSTLVKDTSKALAGSITPTGALVKNTLKNLAGAITPAGALSSIVIFTQAVAGSLTPAGTLVKQTLKALAGVITPSGTIVKQTSKITSGAITPTGTTAKETQKPVSGDVTPAGALTAVAVFAQAVSGLLAPVGALVTQFIEGGEEAVKFARAKLGKALRLMRGL